jgi:hypothetical protein
VSGARHTRHTRRLAVAVGGALLITACSSGHPGSARTKTVTVPAPTPTVRTTTSTTPSPTPRPQTSLGGPCDALLPLFTVEQTISRDVAGQTAFVVGVPDKTIHRLAYLNCRYGIPEGAQGAAAVPAIEIGVSLYSTAGYAQRRLTATIDDYEAHGADRLTRRVAGHPAVLLTGSTQAGYDAPLLVLAYGQRTVAVNIAEPMPAPARDRAMVALAALALDRTAG